MRSKFALLCLVPGTLAFQLPFKVPDFFSSKALLSQVLEETPVSTTPRIAIIGAGAGGSSAAFWISKAKERFGVEVEIDVYESSDYIGGRSTAVYPYNDTSLREFELGASIFVPANKNLWRASEEFNLTKRDFHDEDYETGIWDGENLLIAFTGGWWDTAKLLWRYGFSSPRRTDLYVRNLINQIAHVYNSNAPKWDTIFGLAQHMGWVELANSTTAEYLSKLGISDKYIDEVVEAATRVNYGQSIDHIHALEGACSMAATGASGIAGGNFQIFENFLNRSGASVFLKTPVLSVKPKSSSSHLWTVKTRSGSVDYKSVILAAPFHSTGIEFPASISEQVPPQPYVHLHVTLLATTSPTFNPAYFGLPPSSQVSQMMLTTHQGNTKPEFNSISYHGLIRDGEWAVKIFSEQEISDEWLDNMFLGKVGWVYRKQWDAYPKLPPTAAFPPVKLERGLYYVNAFEPLISTMETETVSSRNVVDLLLNDEFSASICGHTISETEADANAPEPRPNIADDKDFVLGWDC